MSTRLSFMWHNEIKRLQLTLLLPFDLTIFSDVVQTGSKFTAIFLWKIGLGGRNVIFLLFIFHRGMDERKESNKDITVIKN